MNVVKLCLKECPALEHIAYISTADQLLPAPFNCAIDSRYWSSKREAEQFLVSGLDETIQDRRLRRSIFRPGFMFAEDQVVTLPLAATFTLMRSFKRDLLGVLVVHVSRISNFPCRESHRV